MSYSQAADYLKTKYFPKIAVICGSGLGSIHERMNDTIEFEYSAIPGFPESTVDGHDGKLVIGTIEGVEIICMVGRFHYYEGHSIQETTFPIRVFALMGVSILIVTNSSGGINPLFKEGDLMVIEDHINLGPNPLRGKNIEPYPRFPSMSNVYNKEMSSMLKMHALDFFTNVHSGVYAYTPGPSYETKAEARYLRFIGADSVGMSTVPEVIVAKHSGMEVIGISLVTNMVIQEYSDSIREPVHLEVLTEAKKRVSSLQDTICGFISALRERIHHQQ